MGLARRFFGWMFGSRMPGESSWQVVLWWEKRRIPYNLLIALWGFVSLMVFFVAISKSGHLKPGEDAVEPLALLFAPLAINACYTLGWLVELPLRAFAPASWSRERFGPTLMRLGVGLSLIVASTPAVVWVVIWLARSVRQQP